MRLTVVLDRRSAPSMWRQAFPELHRPATAALPADPDWPPEAHDALQRGLESLRDRLDGVGIDEATITVHVVPSDQEVDVRAALTVAERKVVRNRVDVDLTAAIDQVLREVGRAVEAGAFDALPSLEHEGRPAPNPTAGTKVPWRMVSDAAHQYAQHCVTNAIRRGELTAGRVDPADLAETALSEQLDRQVVNDLPAVLRVLCERIEQLLAEEIARESEPELSLDAPEPGDGPEVVQDEPADTPPPQVADHLGAEPDLEDRIARAEERHQLTQALFTLAAEDRDLFVEHAAEGFPVDVIAAARGQREQLVVRRLRRIVRQLGRRLGMTPEQVVAAYASLGQEVRDERLVIGPSGIGPREISAFD